MRKTGNPKPVNPILVNGRHYRHFAHGLDTRLRDEDLLAVFPARGRWIAAVITTHAIDNADTLGYARPARSPSLVCNSKLAARNAWRAITCNTLKQGQVRYYNDMSVTKGPRQSL